MTLAIHPLTQCQLEAFGEQPGHALILSGAAGVGKLSLANNLAENILNLGPDGFADYPYGLTISPIENKAIGIDAIRQLEHFLSLKVPNNKPINRVIIIENSHLLTIEAQNALLKTLEEPPAATLIILTTAQDKALLPTVRSRAVSVNVRRPEHQALAEQFSNTEFERFYALSGGLPGLMASLINEADHPLKSATERARQLLGQSTYERLTEVDELSRQRAETLNILFILQNMAHLSLQKATSASTKRWQRILGSAYGAQTALESNAQPKLALTQLMLHL